MRMLAADARLAVRRLRSSPGFTGAAVLTLAIGIAATASIFAVVDGVLIKPLPYRDADHVLAIWEVTPHGADLPVSPPNFLDWRGQATSFAALAAMNDVQYTVTGTSEAERVNGLAVTPSYFRAVGLAPVVGRSLAIDSSGPPEVVIGYGVWQRRFGGDVAVVGRSILLDGVTHRVVGVMPPGVPGPAELWTRLSFSASDLERGTHSLDVVGRLKPAVTTQSARRDLALVAARLAHEYPRTNRDWSIGAEPIADKLVGNVRPALVALLCAAVCVLLVGAANLANLFLVRYLTRQRELAVRAALGATHSRLLSALVLEALIVGIGGCALGTAGASVGIRVLGALAPAVLPRADMIAFDGRVVACCAVMALAAALIFGGLPAWRASRASIGASLHGTRDRVGSRSWRGLQSALVVAQVALALILLTGAGLFVDSFVRLRTLDTGFRPSGVLTMQVDLPTGRYPTPQRQGAFITTLLERLVAVPGVTSASASSSVPGTAGNMVDVFAIVAGPPTDPLAPPYADIITVTPGYFATLGIRLERGRGILPADDERARRVAVIDESLAQRYFGGQDPLGRLIVVGSDTIQVVGIAPPVKQRGLAEAAEPAVYVPLAQLTLPVADLELRTLGDPHAITRSARQVIRGLDDGVPVSDVKTIEARLDASIGTTRFATLLASIFSAIAWVLGIVGLYGVLTDVVRSRQRELGIRIALGATRPIIMTHILRYALVLTCIGIGAGSLGAWLVTRTLGRLFVGVNPHDPAIFLSTAVVFAIVALVASSLPALHATRIDPRATLAS